MSTKVLSSIIAANGLVQGGSSIDSTAVGQVLIRDSGGLNFRPLTTADVSGFVEDAQDAVAAMIAAGTHSGISFAYNDAANSLSATVTGGTVNAVTLLKYGGLD